MRLAIGCKGEWVAPSFGHCTHFRLIDIEAGQIINREDIYDDVQLRFKRPQFLKNLGVDCLIINDIGTPGFKLLDAFDIDVVFGEHKRIDEALTLFLKGELTQPITPHEPHHHTHH